MGRFPYELEALPVDEYDRLLAWYSWRNKGEKTQQQEDNKAASFLAEIKNRTKS